MASSNLRLVIVLNRRDQRFTLHVLSTRDSSVNLTVKVGLITLDIKNEFNTALWASVLDALRGKDIPTYLWWLIDSYLANRTLHYQDDEVTTAIELSNEVPQDSVLGPTHWNVLYDRLLRLRLPKDTKLLVFIEMSKSYPEPNTVENWDRGWNQPPTSQKLSYLASGFS